MPVKGNTQRDKPQNMLCLQQVVIPPFFLPTQRNVSLYAVIWCTDWFKTRYRESKDKQAVNPGISQHVTHSKCLGLTSFLFWVISILRKNYLYQSCSHKIIKVLPPWNNFPLLAWFSKHFPLKKKKSIVHAQWTSVYVYRACVKSKTTLGTLWDSVSVF